MHRGAEISLLFVAESGSALRAPASLTEAGGHDTETQLPYARCSAHGLDAAILRSQHGVRRLQCAASGTQSR